MSNCISNIEDIENIYDINSYIDNLEIIEELNERKDKLIDSLKEDNKYKSIIIKELINHIDKIIKNR